MCGILAVVSPVFSAEQAARALESLRHRGPDGHGTWRNARGDVLLGHTRLSIIDPEGGRQPLVNEQGDVAVVVNGEFYDYERAMRELTARGHRFRTRSDSEILVHLYEEHGLDAVQYLRGEFAYVVWDESRSRLVAGRDRFGVKPLFYSVINGELWMASEAKALFAAGLAAEWDEVALYQSLFLIQEAGRSLFAGVEQVPAGHQLVFESGRVRTIPYWDLDYPAIADIEPVDEDEALGAFRGALDDAVRVRLRADTRVCYFLSGGIDSSSVVALASRRWSSPGRTFTVRFCDPAYDEGEQARETATNVGAVFTPIDLSNEALADAYPEAVAQAESIGNLHAAARYLQCRAVRQAGYKVALTGDGADEVLAGYAHYADDATGASARDLPAALRPMQARLGHVPQWTRMLAVERSIFNLLLARDYRERMRSRQPYAECLDSLDWAGQMEGRDPLHQSLYLWSKTMLPNYVLVAERLEMAFAVETRPPFLDHLLFDVIRRLQPSLLVRHRQGKNALRQVARTLVGESILTQAKHPFAAPPQLSCPGSPLRQRVDQTFREGGLRALPFFDAPAVLALWEELPGMAASQRFAVESILLMIFCACVLHERYVRH
jgi:asparagine synthase (glutamine-hydrolysing)